MRAKIKPRKENNIKRKHCPICTLSGTVGEIITNTIDNANRLEAVYFCSECLCEFDDRGLRVINSSGKYLGIDTRYKYVGKG